MIHWNNNNNNITFLKENSFLSSADSVHEILPTNGNINGYKSVTEDWMKKESEMFYNPKDFRSRLGMDDRDDVHF